MHLSSSTQVKQFSHMRLNDVGFRLGALCGIQTSPSYDCIHLNH